MSQKGLFITVEGTEGVGKSSNMALISQLLEAASQNHVLSREPGGTPLAEDIRELLVSPREERVAEMAELLLVFAARAQHLHEFIIPTLNAGEWVVCDRFTDATFAYQGAARQMGETAIAHLETLVQGELRPDITLLLDAPVEVGMSRAGKRGKLDRFEREQLTFFEAVRQCYLQRAAAEPARIYVIDASRPLAEVQSDISRIITDLIQQHRGLHE